MRIILASQSPYRRAQLEAFGLRFEAVKPDVDEEALKHQGPADLEELTRFLAAKKAESLYGRFADAVLLGSDQLVEIEGRRLDKPGSRERAIEQLMELAGKEHRLLTSLAMIHGERREIFTDRTRIRFRNFDREFASAYVDLDQPMDCAGSYKIERAGLALVTSLASDDPSAIQGLPLLSLQRGFEALNIPLSSVWRKS